jgi:hypothetical protein
VVEVYRIEELKNLAQLLSPDKVQILENEHHELHLGHLEHPLYGHITHAMGSKGATTICEDFLRFLLHNLSTTLRAKPAAECTSLADTESLSDRELQHTIAFTRQF